MTDADISRRVVWLARLLGVGGLALMGVTWKLWTPQDVFPRVPLFWWAPPHWLDWSALGVTVVGLVALLFATTSRARSIAAAVTACGFALLFVSDQHRLQPWAWQFFILAAVLALGDERTVFYGWRWLVVSIYAWSALSKFDAAFVQDYVLLLRNQLIDAWNQSALVPPRFLFDRALRSTWEMGWAFPIAELTVALLLMLQKTRYVGWLASCLMHGLLLVLLGPAGLGHTWGVLGWNVFSLVQNYWLFRSEPRTESNPVVLSDSLSNGAARGVLAFVILWPALEPWGYCDTWLGWAVYAPRYRDIEMLTFQQAHYTGRIDLSTGIDASLLRKEGERIIVPEVIKANRWSLDALGVPVYPQERFKVGVLVDVAERDRTRPVLLIARERNGRWDPTFRVVEERELFIEDLHAYARTFRLNAFPESYYRRLEAERRARNE